MAVLKVKNKQGQWVDTSVVVAVQKAIDGDGVAINNQNKAVTIRANGTQTINADTGYTGLGTVTINTEVPTSPSATFETEEKTISVTTNGQTIIEKSPGKDGMTRVTVNVNVPSGTSSMSVADFSRIGYSNVPLLIDSEIKKSERIIREWNPDVDHIGVSFDCLFLPSLASNSAISLDGVCRGCLDLAESGDLDFPNAREVYGIFENCRRLIKVGKCYFDKAPKSGAIFYDCVSLQRIEELRMNSVTSFVSCFNGCSSLRFLKIMNLGYMQNFTEAKLHYSKVYGINDESNPDARQSLVDSLLTYSFDRRSAGYADAKVYLSQESYAVLSPEEIAQINAKGFILTTEVPV